MYELFFSNHVVHLTKKENEQQENEKEIKTTAPFNLL